MDEITLEDGKYKFYIKDHILYCDRYSEKWRDFCGDGAVFSLFDECLELKSKLSSLMVVEGLVALDEFEATGDRTGFREWKIKYGKDEEKGEKNANER